MEFKIIEHIPGRLAFNFEELKKSLETELLRLDNFEVSADKIQEAKTTRASLNKVKTVIDNRRKELKAEFMKPYEVVDAQAKELTGLIDRVMLGIDSQVKAIEQAEKDAKYEEIVDIWNEKSYTKIEISEIFDSRWLNKTVSLKKVEEEIDSRIAEIETNLKVIESLVDDASKVQDLQAKYLVSLNLQATLNAYELEKEAKAKLDKPTQQDIQVVEEVEQEVEELYELSFKVIATEKQINELNAYLKAKNIKVERI